MVKSSVKGGKYRERWAFLFDHFDHAKCVRIMERRQFATQVDLMEHTVINAHRVRKYLAAMNNSNGSQTYCIEARQSPSLQLIQCIQGILTRLREIAAVHFLGKNLVLLIENLKRCLLADIIDNSGQESSSVAGPGSIGLHLDEVELQGIAAGIET